MQVNGHHHTTIEYRADTGCVQIIDQTRLPYHFAQCELRNLNDCCTAIRDMQVRGAPLIGITAAYGLALALQQDSNEAALHHAREQLLATRPTAVNLRWALDQLQHELLACPAAERAARALARAHQLRDDDQRCCEQIGTHGLTMIQSLADTKPGTINILTHCNAGWLATVDWGTALAPIYKAHAAGIPLHIWVDETRPRNQGASLTAWELQQQGIPHTVIADNTGGHLMQHGQVDLCLVGSDRTTASGDVCNKIGTYLKALAARDNGVPFYVALPTSTIDWSLDDGIGQIPIEQRAAIELTHIRGLDQFGKLTEVCLFSGSPAANYAFDVTPARLVSGLVTEHGMFTASREGLAPLQALIDTAQEPIADDQ